MEENFIHDNVYAYVKNDVRRFAETAEYNRIYHMADIVQEIYRAEFASEEFWRVAPAVGQALRTFGFVQIMYKNRRIWVRKPKTHITA